MQERLKERRNSDQQCGGRRFADRVKIVRRTVAWWMVCAVMTSGVGCNSNIPEASGVDVELTLDPSPPVVGDAGVSLKLTDAGGAPLKGAEVRVEGNMNHAGMKPSFADLEETEPGRYSGTLDFTMGGDWFLLVTATTQDGKSVEKKIDVPGVKSK